jgi:hypothetical protein
MDHLGITPETLLTEIDGIGLPLPENVWSPHRRVSAPACRTKWLRLARRALVVS